MEKDLQQFDLLIELYKEVREVKALLIKGQDNTANEYIDVETICRCFKLSKKTIRRYRQQGLIPYHQIKGKVYFIESEVKEALKRHYYGSKNSE